MKKRQLYTVTVKFPRDSSSNVSEVDCYEVEAVSEAQALEFAKLKATVRLKAFLTDTHGRMNPRPLFKL